MRSIVCRFALYLLFAGAGRVASAQQLPLKAHVELVRNNKPLKDASAAVVWLTPISEATAPPRQKLSDIPKLTQHNKSFQPSLVVVPVGGQVEFPNRDP